MPSKKNKNNKKNKHEVVFEWPHPEPREVIVSGTFNGWARTCHLTKGPNGFSATVKVPWGSKTAYKYIVDGVWTTHPDQPTETDHDGNINNMYAAPPKPSTVNGNGEHAPEPAPITTTGTLPQLVAHFADTVAAREGTSSALGYVASGLGAAIHNAVGVDPINAEQIAIPTPLQTAATTTSGFDAPDSAVTEDTPLSAAPATEEPVAVSQAPESGNADVSKELEVALKSEPSVNVPSDTPASIVPVNAPENNAVPTAAVESVSVPAEETHLVGDATVEKEDEIIEPSTHTVTVLNGITPVEEGAGVKAEEGLVAVATENTEPLAEATDAAEPASVEDNDEPSEAVVPIVTTIVPVAAAAAVASAVTASSDDAPSAAAELPASKDISVEAPKPIDTPQVTTPDSDLNPSSVLSPEETLSGASAAAAAASEKATPKETSILPVVTPQKELDMLKQPEAEAEVVPKAEEAKVEHAPAPEPEPAPEVVEKESEPEESEVAFVEPWRSSEVVPVQEAPKEVVNNGSEPAAKLAAEKKAELAQAETAPAVELTKMERVENVPEPVTEPTPEATQAEPENTLVATVEHPSRSEPAAVPVGKEEIQGADAATLAPAAPTAAESEPSQPQVTDSLPSPTSNPSTTDAVLVHAADTSTAKPSSAPATQTAVVEPIEHKPQADESVKSAESTKPAEQITESPASLPSPVPVTKAAAVEPTPEPKSQPVEPAPAAKPSAQTNGTNGHAKETSSTSTAPPAKESFPSTVSAGLSTTKAETVPARKKKSSIFGKLKHIFTGGDSDKKKP